jgi:hypothetical protein
MVDFLEQIKKYIEDTEVKLDRYIGYCKNLDMLIIDEEMPSLYYQVISKIHELGDAGKS